MERTLAATMPGFIRTPPLDSMDEFSAFHAAKPVEAAESMASLVITQENGLNFMPLGDVLGPVDLYCNQVAGWGVFYDARNIAPHRAAVVVLYVAKLVGHFQDHVDVALTRQKLV